MIELSPLTIYLIGQLKAFNVVCFFIVVLGGLALLWGNFIKSAHYCAASTEHSIKQYHKVAEVVNRLNKYLGPIVFVAFMGLAFLPSRSTVAAMIVVPAISANQSIQNISKGALQWAEQYIQEQLNPKKEK